MARGAVSAPPRVSGAVGCRAGPAGLTELGALWASEGIKVPKGEGCKQVVSGWQRKRSGGSLVGVMPSAAGMSLSSGVRPTHWAGQYAVHAEVSPSRGQFSSTHEKARGA